MSFGVVHIFNYLPCFLLSLYTNVLQSSRPLWPPEWSLSISAGFYSLLTLRIYAAVHVGGRAYCTTILAGNLFHCHARQSNHCIPRLLHAVVWTFASVLSIVSFLLTLPAPDLCEPLSQEL